MTGLERRRRALDILGLPEDGGRAEPIDGGHRNRRISGKWRFKSCESKKRYRTISDAHRTAKNCHVHRGVKLHAYFCQICHGYHLTKSGTNRRGDKVF